MAKKKKPNWDSLLEALKEPLRLAVFALISWGIAELSQLDVQWAVFGTFLLRFIERIQITKRD